MKYFDITLNKTEVEKIQKLHFKKTGLLELCRNNITEDVVVEKLGKVSAELEDLGVAIVSKKLKEVIGNAKFTWSVNFNTSRMTVSVEEA